MNLQLQSTAWEEFFYDPNVRFPKNPKILQGISVYDAPYGLGLLFRGGPHMFVMRGNNVSSIYKDLIHLLQGKHTLNDIFNEATKNYGEDELAYFLKSLHANSLLDDPIEVHSEVVQKNGTLICIKNAENGRKKNQEIARTLRA